MIKELGLAYYRLPVEEDAVFLSSVFDVVYVLQSSSACARSRFALLCSAVFCCSRCCIAQMQSVSRRCCLLVSRSSCVSAPIPTTQNNLLFPACSSRNNCLLFCVCSPSTSSCGLVSLVDVGHFYFSCFGLYVYLVALVCEEELEQETNPCWARRLVQQWSWRGRRQDSPWVRVRKEAAAAVAVWGCDRRGGGGGGGASEQQACDVLHRQHRHAAVLVAAPPVAVLVRFELGDSQFWR